MSSGLRRRLPWKTAAVTAEEEVPLLEVGATTAGEAAAEGAAEVATFTALEEAGLTLDATGVGAPIGLTIGALTALGFGAYEIYKYLKPHKPKLKLQKVEREHKKALKDPKTHLENARKRIKEVAEKRKQLFDVVPLEDQQGGIDTIPLEHQNIEGTSAGFVPPPYKYLGPGNSLNRGPPYNLIDGAAQEHDNEYDKAKTKEDVYKSDRKFLSSVGNHLVEGIAGQSSFSEVAGAVIGGVGIGAKHLLEKSTGQVLYPSVPGNLSWLRL